VSTSERYALRPPAPTLSAVPAAPRPPAEAPAPMVTAAPGIMPLFAWVENCAILTLWPDVRQSATTFHVASGSYVFIPPAIFSVLSPRSFSYTRPSRPTMNVMIPVDP
jgi:hypothetical protein